MFVSQLTSSNLEVKKFVAFQEGFERLFDIMSGEGMLEGGSVIVKDCLHVCHNLLSGSALTKVGRSPFAEMLGVRFYVKSVPARGLFSIFDISI